MNNSLIIILAFCLLIIGVQALPKHRLAAPGEGKTYETDTKFHKYEILYPDYAHTDTLVVIQADSLNWCMEHYDIASDGDISDVLYAYCSKY